MKTVKSLDKEVSKRYILSMKKVLLRIFSILLFVVAINAAAFIDYFQAHSEGDDIILEWKTGEEVNLDKFVIERKTPQSSYIVIEDNIEPKGSNSYYKFRDGSAYKTEDLVFTYQLNIFDKDGKVSKSNEITVSHNVSDVKRTWGSIKAMFR
ncbi:MAG: hypothetical protein P8Y79_14400 [Ignavibacteriaceae bacterium]